MTSLRTLNVSYTRVVDVSPIAQLKNLGELRIEGVAVNDEQIEQLRKALPTCEIVR